MDKKDKIAFGRLKQMRNDQLEKNKKIKIGFIGGGPNSFIGYSHRLASRFDNRFDFVAGVFPGGVLMCVDFVLPFWPTLLAIFNNNVVF